MTLEEMRHALAAASYYAHAGRLNNPASTLWTLAAIAGGTASLAERVAIDAMVEDYDNETRDL